MLICTLVVSVFAICGSVVSTAAQPGRHGHDQGAVPQRSSQVQPAKVVNDRCPIEGEEVDPVSPTRTWKGRTIGFCCPGCETKWDAKPEAEKDAFLAKYVKVDAASPAALLSKQFQIAITNGDLAAMNKRFLADGKVTVLENGADEGTWEVYRDGQLKAEPKELVGYAWNTKAEAETRHGSTSIVRQVGTFSTGPDAARRTFAGAITLIVVDEGGTPKTAHMHWSSREVKAPAK